jgi:hypothetical protein
LTETINRVRSIALSGLVRFSNLEQADSTESYLFKDDAFCGIRYSLGAFQAKWMLDEKHVIFYRGANQIDSAAIEPDSIRRAA